MKPNFKEIRKSLRMNQLEMAVKAQVSTSYIHLLENGLVDTETMQSRTRQGIARAYGVDPLTGEPAATEDQTTTPMANATEMSPKTASTGA